MSGTAWGRGIGFGPDPKNGATVHSEFFNGAALPLVSYLGATETSQLHLQVGYFDHRTSSKDVTIRLDPMAVVY
jgi:hypothetical protein